MEIFNTVLFSVLFAMFMKVAREIGDGRMAPFKGSGIFFGVLWGFFAANLILYDPYLANIWMASLAGWVFRSKVNQLNIAIGAVIMFLAFLIKYVEGQYLFDLWTFLVFFLVMTVSGTIHDVVYKKKILSRKLSELMHSIIFFTFLPLGYGFLTGRWEIFASLFSFMLAYEFTRKLIYAIGTKPLRAK